MTDYHFISYSSVDGRDFAIRLRDELEAGQPSIPVWFDKRDLDPGRDWDTQIATAISVCSGLLFVMTPDSVDDRSVCKPEWTRALRYKKPVIPMKFHPDADLPFRLANREYINFSRDFNAALARLRLHLRWLPSPEGVLQSLQDRLADAQRDLRRATTPEQEVRIQDDIKELNQQIAAQQRVVDDPQGTARRVEESIARGLERERQPEQPVGGEARSKFINPPPGIAPSYFQDRHVETKLIGDFLQNDAQRLMTVVGRAGIGKTAMVCRLLKALEGGQLPDDGGPLSVDGIVYLSATGSRQVTMPNMYADLCQLLADDTARKLDELYKNPHVDSEAKIQTLLAEFRQGRTVLLLDNFEDLIDPETRHISDAELDEALRAVLNAPQHAVKVILTTRVAPFDLALVQPGRQTRQDLDEGLESPYAENILREMDVDGKVGLKTAPDEVLDEARQRTRGYPRALEALFAILSADRDTSLHEILETTETLLPENVVEVLVGEAFSRLGTAAQMVMQALAAYARPVTPTAVNYLLQPHLSGVDSASVLSRLVNMQFARREAGRYYLHPVDRAYALSRVPIGEVSDRDEEDTPPFTQFALLHRGANYFQQTRIPRENWKTIDDLAPQLAEFDLRCEGQDYDVAAEVLLEIDLDYLLLWGHNRLMVQLHERLQGKLRDPELKQNSAGNLGSAYANIGKVQEAIICYEQALYDVREMQDRQGEGTWLGNLGNRYSDLGQTTRAIDFYEQALAIAREIGDRYVESGILSNFSNIYVDQGAWDLAIELSRQAMKIADEIANPQFQVEARLALTFAHLYAGDLLAARDVVEAARQFDIPEHNHKVRALLGVIALRQDDRTAAAEAFAEALGQAESMLGQSAQNYAASDTKGLALCGLTLCDQGNHIAAAIEAYRAARAINRDFGIVARVLRLFDALALADPDGGLAEVRGAAAGE